MSTRYADELCYSTEELSQLLDQTTPAAEIDGLATTTVLRRDGTTGAWQLEPNDRQVRSWHFRPAREVPAGRYDLPDDLRDHPSPWARTLVEMYQERIAFPTSVSPDQGAFLQELVCKVSPKTVLEIGCFTGISTLWLASGLELVGDEGMVHSVDVFGEILPSPPHHYEHIDKLETARNAVAAAQLSHRVRLHKSDSKRLALNMGAILEQPLDLLFIDGDHSVKGCLADFLLFYPHVAVGGYIVLHDIYPENCGYGGPRYVIDRCIKESPYFDLVEINTRPHNYGLALIRKRGHDRGLYAQGRLLRKVVPGWLAVQNNPRATSLVKSIIRRTPIVSNWL